MDIKINCPKHLSYKLGLGVATKYIEENEFRMPTSLSGMFDLGSFQIKETGKHPIQIEFGSSRYHVKCKETKTLYVFTIWKAS